MENGVREFILISPLTIGKNKKGHISLLGITFSLALLCLTLIHYTQVKLKVKEMEQRAKTYLCLRHFIESSKKQIHLQKGFNLLIKGLNGGILLASTQPQFLAVLKIKKKMAIKVSQLTYAHFIATLIPRKWCHFLNQRLRFHNLFQTRGLLLKRSLEGTSLLKNRWNFILSGKHVKLKGTFNSRQSSHKQKGNPSWTIQEITRGLF